VSFKEFAHFLSIFKELIIFPIILLMSIGSIMLSLFIPAIEKVCLFQSQSVVLEVYQFHPENLGQLWMFTLTTYI
jgi:hypothetical protein